MDQRAKGEHHDQVDDQDGDGQRDQHVAEALALLAALGAGADRHVLVEVLVRHHLGDDLVGLVQDAEGVLGGDLAADDHGALAVDAGDLHRARRLGDRGHLLQRHGALRAVDHQLPQPVDLTDQIGWVAGEDLQGLLRVTCLLYTSRCV